MLTPEQTALMAKRRSLDAKIRELKAEARQARIDYDTLTQRLAREDAVSRAALQAKIGSMTAADRAKALQSLNS